MTLAIPDQLRKRLAKHSEVRWSKVARQALEEKLSELEWMDNLLSRSEFTEEDAERIGHEIKDQIWKKFDKRFA